MVLVDADDLFKERKYIKAIKHVASSGDKSDSELDIRDERTAEDDNLMCSEEHLKDSNIKACPLSGVPKEANLSTDSFDIYIAPEERI